MKSLFLFLCLFTSSLHANPITCAEGMAAPADPSTPFKLGIGVLIEDINGQKFMGVSPYAGALHQNILSELRGTHILKRILWMGELRYRSSGVNLEISEANETSGFSVKLQKDGGFVQDGRVIPIVNSVREIPAAWKSPDYRGYTFDPRRQRLAKELSRVRGDIRHGIGDALQAIQTIVFPIQYNTRPEEELLADLRMLQSKHNDKLLLVRWLIRSLIDDGRVRSEMNGLRMLLETLMNPRTVPSDVRQLDLSTIDAQIERLSRIVTLQEAVAPVVQFLLR